MVEIFQLYGNLWYINWSTTRIYESRCVNVPTKSYHRRVVVKADDPIILTTNQYNINNIIQNLVGTRGASRSIGTSAVFAL